MTDRNELTKRIAHVVGKHKLIRWEGRAWWCACGDDCLNVEGAYGKHVADHVADEVVSVLPAPNIDKVAEAIWKADRPHAKINWDTESNTADYYRRMARAAVENLGLVGD